MQSTNEHPASGNQQQALRLAPGADGSRQADEMSKGQTEGPAPFTIHREPAEGRSCVTTESHLLCFLGA